MRCHLITAKADDVVIARRLAPTTADARATRETLMEEFAVRKKDVEIEPHEVPVSKAELLEYLNELYAEMDFKEGAE